MNVILGQFLGGWELLLGLFLLFVAFVLLSASLSPNFSGGVGRARRAFFAASDNVGFEAGRHVGGIYGKQAAEALTPHNQTAELYNPDAFRSTLAQKPGFEHDFGDD